MTIGEEPSAPGHGAPRSAGSGSSAAARSWGTATITASAPSQESAPTTAKRSPIVVMRWAGQRRWTVTPAAASDARGRIADDLLQRRAVQPDVTGGGVAQQALLEDEGPQLERRLGRRQIQRGQRDQVPQRSDRARALAVFGQPRSERARVVWGDAAEGERRAPCRDPLPPRQVGVAQQRPRQVQRRARSAAAERHHGATGGQHGDLEARLQLDERLAAERREQLAICRAAAQEHVLAVVDPQLAPGDRIGGAAEPRADLDEGHRRAGRGAIERRDDSGDAAADDDDVHGRAPSRLRAATPTLVQGPNATRCSRIAAGSASMRSSRRR